MIRQRLHEESAWSGNGPMCYIYGKMDGQSTFKGMDVNEGIFVDRLIYATIVRDDPEGKVREKLQKLADMNKDVHLVLQLRDGGKVVFQTKLAESRLRRGRIMEDVNWSKNDSKVAMEEMKAGLENALGIKLKRGSADSFSTTYENKDNEVDIEVFRETDDEGEEYRAFVDVNFFVGNQQVFNFFEEIPNDPRERKSLVREVVKQIKKPRYPEYVRGVH